jgi:hypothetical protein
VRRVRFVLLLALTTANADAQSPARRLTTVDGLRQFSGFYHLQNVTLRGELAERNGRLVLQSDAHEMRVVLSEGVSTTDGPVEVRGQLIDVGRLEAGDPRAARDTGIAVDPVTPGDVERWPRPGEDLFVRLTSVSGAQPATTPSVRALALEPWRFGGRTVTTTGNFRGRNLFGDLPGAPGKGRYDFVLRGAEGAIWVTGREPRGRGFDLDVNRRVDTGRWVEVTGTVTEERGLVLMNATSISIAEEPQVTEVAEEPDEPVVPLVPVEVVFSAPTEGETDVNPNAPIRLQFSRGLDEASLPDRIRVSYLGAPGAAPPVPAPAPAFTLSYDAAARAIELRLSEPMQPFRTVRVEVLEGLEGFDGAPVTPFTLTFSVGG